MAATASAALKTWLEAQSLGVPVFRRRPPEPPAPPFILVIDGISAVVEGHEDGGRARGGTTPVTEDLQVDLYYYENDPKATPGGLTESYSLPYRLAQALDGADLGSFATPAIRIYGCTLVEGPRELESPTDPNLIRKTYTVAIRRDT